MIKQNLHFNLHCWCQAVTDSTVSAVMNRVSLGDIPVLLQLCRDKDTGVQVGAEQTLVEFGDRALPALEEAKGSSDTATAGTAGRIIWLQQLRKDLRVAYHLHPTAWRKIDQFNQALDLGDVRLETGGIVRLVGSTSISLVLKIVNHSPSPVSIEAAELVLGQESYPAHPGGRSGRWNAISSSTVAESVVSWELERPLLDLIGRGCELHLVLRVGSEARQLNVVLA